MPTTKPTPFEQWYRPIRDSWPVFMALIGIGWYQIKHNFSQEASTELIKSQITAVLQLVGNLDERLQREEKFRDAHPTSRQSGRDRIPHGDVNQQPEESVAHLDSGRRALRDVLEAVSMRRQSQ